MTAGFVPVASVGLSTLLTGEVGFVRGVSYYVASATGAYCVPAAPLEQLLLEGPGFQVSPWSRRRVRVGDTLRLAGHRPPQPSLLQRALRRMLSWMSCHE